MEFNKEQKLAITSDKPFIVVSAGAGSGKTRILTERYTRLVELCYKEPDNEAAATVDGIVAITFTEKAASEMKDRIRQRFVEKEHESANEDEAHFWKQQKEALEYAQISTFHSFCERLLKQYAMEANLVPNFRVIDDVASKKKKRAILKQLCKDSTFMTKMSPFLRYISKENMLETLMENHEYILEHIVGEDIIMSLDANTLYKQQIGEVTEQLKEFHEELIHVVSGLPKSGLTGAQQRDVNQLIEFIKGFPQMSDVHHYTEELLHAMPKRKNSKWSETMPAFWDLYNSKWELIKGYSRLLQNKEEVQQAEEIIHHYVYLLQRFSEIYKEEKERLNELDFTDLQQKAVTLLNKKEIQEHCREQYRHMMVDEFQDTNILQLTVLERISPYFRFIVGDEKQSIYRFRGANVQLMNEQQAFAEKDEKAELIFMNTNYRTQKAVIDPINELFSQVMAKERTLPYETVYTPLTAFRQREEDKKRIEYVKIAQEDKENQFEKIAHRIVQMVHGEEEIVEKDQKWERPTYADIAILIPTRTNLLELERALNDVHIPYIVHGGIGFYERQEIIDYLTLLRWLNRPFEEIHLLALLRSPLCGLTLADFYTMKQALHENEHIYELVYNCDHPAFEKLDETIQQVCLHIQQWLEKWTPFRTRKSLRESLYELFVETNLKEIILLQRNGLQKVKNVEKFIEIICDLGEVDLETILQEVDELIALGEKESEADVEIVEDEAVQIMTIHSSKGLEFPVVFLPRIDRKYSQNIKAISYDVKYGLSFKLAKLTSLNRNQYSAMVKSEELEEWKRLFYVAATRARDYLYMIGIEKSPNESFQNFLEQALEAGNISNFIRESEEVVPIQTKERERYDAPEPKVIEEIAQPISFSVSEIMLYMNDREAYIQRYLLGLHVPYFNEAGGESKQTYDPTVVGTIVHRACELRDHGLTVAAAIEHALEESEKADDTATRQEVKQLISRYTDEERVKLGEPIVNEWDFSVMVDGIELIGEIDKVVRKDSKLHLIDFKTNKIDYGYEHLIDYYRPQLYLYKLAYEEIMNDSIDTLALYLLRDRSNPLKEISINDEYGDKMMEVLNEMKTLHQSRTKYLVKN